MGIENNVPMEIVDSLFGIFCVVWILTGTGHAEGLGCALFSGHCLFSSWDAVFFKILSLPLSEDRKEKRQSDACR